MGVKQSMRKYIYVEPEKEKDRTNKALNILMGTLGRPDTVNNNKS